MNPTLEANSPAATTTNGPAPHLDAVRSADLITIGELMPVCDYVQDQLHIMCLPALDRPQCIQAFQHDQQVIAGCQDRALETFKSVLYAILDNRTTTAGAVDTESYVTDRLAALFRHGPEVHLFDPHCSSPDFVSQPLPALQVALARETGRVLNEFLQWCAYGFNTFVERGLGGSILWYGRGDVCQLDYTLSVITDRLIGEKSQKRVVKQVDNGTGREIGWRDFARDGRTVTEELTTSTDVELSSVLQRHVHRLVDAESHPLPARHVPMPPRIAQLVETLVRTEIFAPITTIVTGDQYDGEMHETEPDSRVRTVTTTRQIEYVLCEPGVVIADRLVLAGWDPREVPPRQLGRFSRWFTRRDSS